MTKFFKCMNCIPIVKALQLLAAVQIALGVLNIVFNIIPQISVAQFSLKAIWAISQLILGNLAQVLFSPFILLGLAVVIQLMRERNEAVSAPKAKKKTTAKKKG